MKGILKWPLILAAIVIVLRIVVEQLGAPLSINNLMSVVILFIVIMPLYFGFRVGGMALPHPYRTLFKLVFLYALLARAMVVPTYWLAYAFQWTAPRFLAGNGGVVGPNITPVQVVVIPLVALVGWVIGAVIIGGGLGSAVVAYKRLRNPVLSQMTPTDRNP